MSIKFKEVAWRNFLSTGNNWTRIDLCKTSTTLVVGENGSGKSTLLEALSFGLFGKPHRNIKKDQLINSINKKGTEVEVIFDVGSHSFKIYRSLKPNKFEIWQNDKLINQSSNVRDYQKYLEQSILKLNHKSFHQIVVLGSSNFIPFMQLPSHARREVIEDLLDIQIFSRMNVILKDHLSKLKEELKNVDYSLALAKEKIDLQKRYIRDIAQLNEDQINEKKNQINSIREEISELQQKNTELSNEIEDKSYGLEDQIAKITKKREKVLAYSAQFKQQIRTVVNEAKFYEENPTCPTCTQVIDTELREIKLQESKDKAKELKEGLEHASQESTDLEQTLERLTSISSEVREANSNISTNNRSISRLQTEIENIKTSIEDLQGKSGDLSKANIELEELRKSQTELSEKKLQLMSDRSYKEAAAEMLKDSGIKTKVIREYLPAMNNLINKYLQVLDFFVSFNLDESFSETIKSRYRDSFNYASFSEGEKTRIDLSILFTWRQIAKMKNSASTNLLVLDEVFDSSLDVDGVDNLLKILSTLDEGTNTFIISHKGEQLDGKFERKLQFVKESNFSSCREID